MRHELSESIDSSKCSIAEPGSGGLELGLYIRFLEPPDGVIETMHDATRIAGTI
jgi:hypothetical protein